MTIIIIVLESAVNGLFACAEAQSHSFYPCFECFLLVSYDNVKSQTKSERIRHRPHSGLVCFDSCLGSTLTIINWFVLTSLRFLCSFYFLSFVRPFFCPITSCSLSLSPFLALIYLSMYLTLPFLAYSDLVCIHPICRNENSSFICPQNWLVRAASSSSSFFVVVLFFVFSILHEQQIQVLGYHRRDRLSQFFNGYQKYGAIWTNLQHPSPAIIIIASTNESTNWSTKPPWIEH